MKRGMFVVTASPSGGGKTSLIRATLERFPDLRYSVSTTTRPPRPEEVDGRDYHFVDRETFEGLRDQGEFVEWAVVHGHLYGTSRTRLEESLRNGQDTLLDLDVQGVASIQQIFGNTGAYVMILPPSWAALEQRLRGRGTDSEQEIRRRLDEARREIRHLFRFDYFIVNDDLDVAREKFAAIVKAERQRVRRMPDEFVEEMLL